MLLLHGWGASSELMLPVARLLPGYRQIVPDLPGFGKAPAPPAGWAVGDYARWTLALLDELGVERAHIIAHSFGGRVAIMLASEWPARVGKLVLTGSAGIRPKRGAGYHARVRWFKLLRWLAGTRWLPGQLQRQAQAAVARRGSDDYRQAHGTMRETFVKVVNEDLTPCLASIRAPTLLVWGERDDATPLADGQLMARQIADAGLVVFEGAGHYAYLEQAPRFAHIVETFFRNESG